MSSRVLAVAALVLLSAGCIDPRPLGYVPARAWPPPRPNVPPSVSVYCADHWRNYWPASSVYPAEVPSACSGYFVKTLEESGQFAKVYNGAAGGDYRIDFTFSAFQTAQSPGGAVLSAMTLTLLPMYNRIYASIATSVTDAKGRPIEKVFYTEGFETQMAIWGSSQIPSEQSTIGLLLKRTLAEIARRGAFASDRS